MSQENADVVRQLIAAVNKQAVRTRSGRLAAARAHPRSLGGQRSRGIPEHR
jgi:hypothetical protein